MSQKVTFTGTVKAIEVLGERELQVIPVDFDSRFAITVHIEEVTTEEGPFKAGTDQIFAVHSPARLFRTGHEDIIGKKYSFKVAWKVTGSGSKFSELTAVPIVEEKKEIDESSSSDLKRKCSETSPTEVTC